LKLLVLASGRGTDFQAIVDHRQLGILQGVEICGLVCNHLGAPVTQRAEHAGITHFEFEGATGRKFDTREDKETARSNFEEHCLEVIQELSIDYIALAGFDQIASNGFVDRCKLRILNIHPALDLKRFGGKNMVGRKVHELVLASGAKYSGCTVHFVTNEIDLGPVILKKTTEIRNDDTPDSLEKRILTLEHLAFPEAIQLVANGRVKFDDLGKRCFVDRYSDGWDLDWVVRQEKYLEKSGDV
jgi:phosphoribosylglycinamide formyltransferase 1